MSDDTFIEGPLYEKRKKVYPQSVRGRFRRIKWTILCVALGTYYLLPFVRWNRGIGLPDQAVLIDFPHRRFYFFIELWPQEVYYFTGLLIIAAMTLFGPAELPKASRDIDVAITDMAGGGRASTRDHFVPGEQ